MCSPEPVVRSSFARGARGWAAWLVVLGGGVALASQVASPSGSPPPAAVLTPAATAGAAPPPPASQAPGRVPSTVTETQAPSAPPAPQDVPPDVLECEEDEISGCVDEGRRLLQAGDLRDAEPPLVKAKEAGSADAYQALAELYDTRGGPGDHLRAAHLRWEGLAADQPASEVAGLARLDEQGRFAWVLALNVQPMQLAFRRLAVGAEAVVRGNRILSLDGYVGYQYFASDWLIPYLHVLGGGVWEPSTAAGVDLGAELGLKLTLPPIGGVEVSLGSTLASPLHVSVGLELNSLIALVLLGQP